MAFWGGMLLLFVCFGLLEILWPWIVLFVLIICLMDMCKSPSRKSGRRKRKKTSSGNNGVDLLSSNRSKKSRKKTKYLASDGRYFEKKETPQEYEKRKMENEERRQGIKNNLSYQKYRAYENASWVPKALEGVFDDKKVSKKTNKK